MKKDWRVDITTRCRLSSAPVPTRFADDDLAYRPSTMATSTRLQRMRLA